jgi:hypothetical protein
VPNATTLLAAFALSACLTLGPAVDVVQGGVEPPVVYLDAVPEYRSLGSYDFSGTAMHDNCPIAAVEYSCDYGAWVPATPADGAFGDSTIEGFEFMIDYLEDGSHMVRVRATTSAGHVTTADHLAAASFIVDTFQPLVVLAPVSPDPTSDAGPETTGWAEDCGSPIACVLYRVDGAAWFPAIPVDGAFDSPREDYTIHTAALGEGEHTIAVQAEDAAGNTSDVAKDTFIVDSLGPGVIMDDVPAYLSCSALFCSGQAADLQGQVDLVRFCLDQGEWLAATATDGKFDESIELWELSVSDLTEGAHNLIVDGVDALGNVTSDREKASASFVVDTVAPSVSLLSTDNAASSEAGLVLRGVASDHTSAVTDVEYCVDGGNWTAAEAEDGSFDGCDEPFTVAVGEVSQGEYLIAVRAVDVAGNVSPPVAAELARPRSVGNNEVYGEDTDQLTGGGELHRAWWLTLLLPCLAMAALVVAVVIARRKKGISDLPGK